MIKTQDLTVDYGDGKGIFDITMSLASGKVYALVGKSGCGKSTLLKALASLISVDKGIFVLGDATHEKTDLGFIQQQDALFPWLSVQENIELGLLGQKGKSNQKQQATLDLLEAVGLIGYEDQAPYALSGGQRQRVAIARTLATQPKVLLMDEPTASLDAITKESLQNLLLKLHSKEPRTTLFVTHSMEEAVFLSDCVMIMSQGRIVSTHTIDLPMTLERRQLRAYFEKVMALKQVFEGEVGYE